MQNFEITVTEIEENPKDPPIVGWVRVPVRLQYFPGRKKNWLGFAASTATVSVEGAEVGKLRMGLGGSIEWEQVREGPVLSINPSDYAGIMLEILDRVSRLNIRKENPDVSIQEGTGETEGV